MQNNSKNENLNFAIVDIVHALHEAYYAELHTAMNYICLSQNLQGFRGKILSDILKEEVKDEFNHAQEIANRINTLGFLVRPPVIAHNDMYHAKNFHTVYPLNYGIKGKNDRHDTNNSHTEDQNKNIYSNFSDAQIKLSQVSTQINSCYEPQHFDTVTLHAIQSILEAETEAINLYNRIIGLCEKNEFNNYDYPVDSGTADMIARILQDEQDHAKQMKELLRSFG